MYTVTLTVDRAWLCLAADPSGSRVVCGTTQTASTDAPLDGELRHYAGGRVKAAVRDQDDRTPQYTLRHLSPADKDRLLSWRGQVVLLRTVEAERVYVVYFNTPYRRVLRTVPDDGSAEFTFDMDVVFLRVSYSESV